MTQHNVVIEWYRGCLTLYTGRLESPCFQQKKRYHDNFHRDDNSITKSFQTIPISEKYSSLGFFLRDPNTVKKDHTGLWGRTPMKSLQNPLFWGNTNKCPPNFSRWLGTWSLGVTLFYLWIRLSHRYYYNLLSFLLIVHDSRKYPVRSSHKQLESWLHPPSNV